MSVSQLQNFQNLTIKVKVFLGVDLGGHGGHSPPTFPLFFDWKNIVHKQKIQKQNINKVYQTEPGSGEMTCLMTIAETKTTFSAFHFFHKHYWNNGSGKLIAAVQASNLRMLELWKSIT